jgi:hypothetical protein
MDLIFEPFVGLGLLIFGMPKSEVKPVQAAMHGVGRCSYQDGKLSAFTIYPSDMKRLLFAGEDVLQMEKLPAALYFAGQSTDYGQAQGGSLYFMDLGCAILQFESSWREFLFFSREHDTGEPFRRMTPYSIEAYYEDNTWGD